MGKLVLLVLALIVLAGCNTARGFGKDVETTGEAIQRTTK